MKTSATQLASDYCMARLRLLDAKLVRAQFRCTEQSEGDPSIGDMGTSQCDRKGSLDEMCENCQKSTVEHAECVRLSKLATAKWRAFRAATR